MATLNLFQMNHTTYIGEHNKSMMKADQELTKNVDLLWSAEYKVKLDASFKSSRAKVEAGPAPSGTAQ
jgi:hypothetical protein